MEADGVQAPAVLFGQRLRLASTGRTDMYTIQHCAVEAPPAHTASALHSVWCREVYSFAPFHSDFTCLLARSSTNWLCSWLTKLSVVDPPQPVRLAGLYRCWFVYVREKYCWLVRMNSIYVRRLASQPLSLHVQLRVTCRTKLRSRSKRRDGQRDRHIW